MLICNVSFMLLSSYLLATPSLLADLWRVEIEAIRDQQKWVLRLREEAKTHDV